MTATPWGFRDILPEEAQAREEIALTVKGCFRELLLVTNFIKKYK